MAPDALVMSGFAGDLRERVVIERRLGGRDALASATGQYAYAGEAWASLIPLASADLTQANSLSTMTRWKVILRKREGLDPRCRLTWRGKYLAVRSVVSDPQMPERMVLTCEELR
jgi:head-tail adaptor